MIKTFLLSRTKAICTYASFLIASISFAQPVINSYTPIYGSSGSVVTISGSNFNDTVANNTVYFGAVKAVVNSASASQLTVTVPTGANYRPLTATVKGNTAYANAFNYTYPCVLSDTLTDSSFAQTPVKFKTGMYPYKIVSGDIDGDGKPELVHTNYLSDNVSVYRNTSTQGIVNSSSFAPAINFTTGPNPIGVTLADIDGDGKLDMCVTSSSGNYVSVYRNIATSGTINSSSFATRVNYTTGTYPYDVAVSELDGDGKPDMAVTNFPNNTVSVLRNISTIGVINSGSFASKVDFTTDANSELVRITDIDGDAKNDLVVLCRGTTSGRLSLFRNTATSGTINSSSFSPKVTFLANGDGTNALDIVVADLDLDGKTDIIEANAYQGVSIFRNTSTSGSISSSSLAAPVILNAGSTKGVDVLDINGDNKPEIVTSVPPSDMLVYENRTTSGTITTASFKIGSNITTISACWLTFIDIDMDKKADIATVYTGRDSVALFQNKYKCQTETTGEKQAELEEGFKLYPNPAYTTLFIEATSNLSNNSIEVLDVTGRLVLAVPAEANKDRSRKEINVSGLQQGIYLIRAGTVVKKFFKG